MKNIHVSMPKAMLDDAKKYAQVHDYASVNEFMRDALRRFLYDVDKKNTPSTELRNKYHA